MLAIGVEPVDPTDAVALSATVAHADAVLFAAAPDDGGCPGFRACASLLASKAVRARWIGYLSTTGVYGDRGGGWVFERSRPNPSSPEAIRRVSAETDWLSLAPVTPAVVRIFRLPGIYGPGRSTLDRVRAGDAQRLVKPGHVFSRIHVDDIALGLEASIRQPGGHALYNLCDDRPAPAHQTVTFAAALLGIEPPPERNFDADVLSPMARRFWAESRRVSNARAKAALGWRPSHASYREGLTAILEGEDAAGRRL